MKQKKVISIVAISIILVTLAGFIIFRMLGIEASGDTQEDITSKWDLDKVNKVYDEKGIPVPVPKGYMASSIYKKEVDVDGETKVIEGERTVNTGFVIYEGEEDIITDDTKAMEEGTKKEQAIENDIKNAQKTRNQWVWVPVANVDEIYETDASGKNMENCMIMMQMEEH